MTRFTRAKLLEHKRNQAWMMHINGMKQWDIAHELDVTQARVSQMIKQAAKEHPVSSLSIEERMAISEERWNISEAEIRTEIAKQLETGVRTVKRITDPMGRTQVEETIEHRVDPALLRALSTHHDRRARQLNNQLSPDAGLQQVNVNLVKDFLSQGDTQGKLSAEQWNQTVDVSPA
jgi:DNA-binding transcriptional regulator LsrR (DeoR family)